MAPDVFKIGRIDFYVDYMCCMKKEYIHSYHGPKYLCLDNLKDHRNRFVRTL
jgi:hypothetical protein